MSEQDAYAFANKDIDNNDKWGPAFAVPIANAKVLGEKEYAVTVRARDHRTALQLGKEQIASKGRARKGTTVQVVKLSASKSKGGGKPQLSFVKDEKTWWDWWAGNREEPDRKTALAKAKEYLERDDVSVGTTIEIRQVKQIGYVKKVGEPSRLPAWTVTGTRQQVVMGSTVGWLFYGIASF
jgi:hypothetical protein